MSTLSAGPKEDRVAADHAHRQELEALREQLRYYQARQAESDRRHAMDEAQTNYLTRLVRDLQAQHP